MVPEALIKIYARVNDISEEMAETEMRYGACYDEPIMEREWPIIMFPSIQELRQLPIPQLELE